MLNEDGSYRTLIGRAKGNKIEAVRNSNHKQLANLIAFVFCCIRDVSCEYSIT